jgi:hypothetical protein
VALTPNFSSSESIASPNLVTFTDTSTGSDGTITTRRIYIRLANGNWLTTAGESTTSAYESWSYSDSSIQLDLLTQSTTGSVTVEWYAGSTLTYTKTILMEWDLYDYLFAFELIQSQTATPKIIQDTNYYSNFFMFITNIWSSEAAVTYGDDLYSSQQCLNQNQLLIDNSDFYF